MSRGNIAIWFDPAMQWYAPSKGKQGRNQTYSDAAIQCCLMIKSLFRLSLRMVTGFVQSLIELCGLNWTAPDYSTLCRRQKHIDIAISYQKSSDGLHLLMDSTGMKFLGEGEWKRKKHGAEYRRQWRKLHIGIDAKTLQIRAIQLTTNNVSDSQVLGDLLNQIPQDEQIDSVYTDGAYDTKQCRQVIADRQAHAVIPPRKNAKPWKDTKSSSLERNELLRTIKRLGRTLWKKWSILEMINICKYICADIDQISDILNLLKQTKTYRLQKGTLQMDDIDPIMKPSTTIQNNYNAPIQQSMIQSGHNNTMSVNQIYNQALQQVCNQIREVINNSRESDPIKETLNTDINNIENAQSHPERKSAFESLLSNSASIATLWSSLAPYIPELMKSIG